MPTDTVSVLRSGAVTEPVVAVSDVGWRARRVISGDRVLSMVAALSRSLYLEAGGEIVWLGPPGSTLHARAIVARDALNVEAAARARIDLGAAREWRPPPITRPVPQQVLAGEGQRLVETIDRLGPPDGFGALLVDRPPAFPLDRATETARDFLHACARDDAAVAAALAERLLGLGPGLTPAGDDLVGGAVFARRLVTLAPEPWSRAAATLRARAPQRTHRISAALLGDLLDGEGYAPLHDLALALTVADETAALDAAARLVRIGHSSGWDILTGFVGALGILGPSRSS